MSIDIAYIKRQLVIRGIQKLYGPRAFGTAIRYRRKELNMTLEECARGICSLSYLSKVENNKIKVSEKYIDALIKRVKLDVNPDEGLLRFDADFDHVWTQLMNKSVMDPKVMSFYQARIDHLAHLMVMAGHMMQEDYTAAFERSIDVSRFIPHYTDQEIALFLYLMNKLMQQTERYGDAYTVLTLVPEGGLKDDRIGLLFKKARLENAYRMRLIQEVTRTYQTCVNQAIDMREYNLLYEIEYAHLAFLTGNENPDIIDKMMSKMHYLTPLQKSYIEACVAFADQRHEAVIKLSADQCLENEDWIRLTLISLDILDDREGALKLISKIDGRVLTRPSSYALINHIRYKHDDDRERILPYMKREVIANMHVGDDYQYLNYIMNDATRIFSKHQHYKDAVQVNQIYQPRIAGLQRLYREVNNS
jgi:HTH-type transcriptional regulator, quorum sensing regulator NprR